MEMGYSTRTSSSVLKLVYPGCFIEKYTKPITAADVMRRHPRHCVARPDVFRNPWIVVRPESVLLPGNVFYVVSFHTLRRLMRSVSDPHEGSGQSFADVADFRRLGKGQSGHDTETCEGSARNRRVRKRIVNDGSLSAKQSDKGRVNYPVKKYLNRSSTNNSFSSTHDRSRDGSSNVMELKSCLKKSKCKLHNLRVRFKLPGDDNKNLQIEF